MAGLSLHHPWAFTFGILGNIISFMVYLAPLPTFYRVYRKKSTEGFQSVPYVVALFSAMLWIFYAFLKTNAYLLITINSFGCVIETIYVLVYLFYATKDTKVYTVKLVVLLNVGTFGLILLLTLLLAEGSRRVQILGWICVGFSISVFAAPLSIIRLVVRTKSVEFMPFSLSFFLTLSAVVWFSYGLLSKDIYVALPNVLGVIFGILQMALYLIYKDRKKVIEPVPEHVIAITKLGGAVEIYTIDSAPATGASEAAELAEQDEDDEKEKKEMKKLEV
nr:SWEET family protein 1 [Heracleum moellendorffii]